MPRGITSSGDIVLADGTNINVLWDDYNKFIDAMNGKKGTLKRLFSYPTTLAADKVPQVGAVDDFEDATEFGVPQSLRSGPDALLLGYNFKWRDKATRFTWRFFRTADKAQVDSVFNQILAADIDQTHRAVLGAIFNNAQRISPEGRTVFPLYNGDGTVPPEYNGQVHPGTHSHYLASGAATVDGQDLKAMIDNIRHHGYLDTPGARLLILANSTEMDVIRTFKAGQGTIPSPFDFIPARGTDAFLTSQQIVGDQAPATYGDLKIEGSFGPAWISESPLIPAGYLLAAVTFGDDDPLNVVGFREHSNAGLRGLLQIPGPNASYPLLESYYARGYGTGVRHRGAAVVMQITANVNYAPPAAYSLVVA